jgi:hypothetical protein
MSLLFAAEAIISIYEKRRSSPPRTARRASRGSPHGLCGRIETDPPAEMAEVSIRASQCSALLDHLSA